MAISAAGIIFSSLNNNTHSRLTSDRTVAAIPFACRYRLVDFALSNLVNAGISNVNIVVNYNYRSLLEHIGSGKDWDLARRKNGVTMISPYQTAIKADSKMFTTRMEALKNMKEYVSEFSEEYVVMMDSHIVLNIDVADIIKKHEKTGAAITIVTQSLKTGTKFKTPRMMISSVAGRVTDIAMAEEYSEKNPEISLNIFVMKTSYLRVLIEEAEAYNLDSLTSFMLRNCKQESYRTYKYSGYVASISSFNDYYACSMELIKSDKARDSIFGKKEFPIFTRVHNSAPTSHRSTAVVENSMIADECTIEGTVINSVIFRDVTIEKGAVVKNSVLFHGTHIGKNANLNCIVTDKDVFVTEGVTLSGNDNMPFYISKKAKI